MIEIDTSVDPEEKVPSRSIARDWAAAGFPARSSPRSTPRPDLGSLA